MQSKQIKRRKVLKQQNLTDHLLSLSESVWTTPYFFSEKGFNPGFFEDKELANLLSASQAIYPVVKEAQNQRNAAKLLTHAVLGQQAEAQKIIEKNSELLLIQSTAVDYSGRMIRATPFQAALGAGDKPMWEMMLKYMEPAEALRQFDAWFPNGIEDTPAAELSIDYPALALAIIQGKEEGQSAIQQFRKDITSEKEITQGTHFNLKHLIAAYQAYYTYFEAFGADGVNRNLFWSQVIGYVQRQMTAYGAQIHCSGMHNVLENPKLFSRKLKFDKGRDFFPLHSNSGLGFDSACYSYWQVLAHCTPPCCTRTVIIADIEKLCNANIESLAELRESLDQKMRYQPM